MAGAYEELIKLAVDTDTTNRISSSDQRDQGVELDHRDVICYDCGYTCKSMQELHNHAHRSHGYATPSRGYCPNTTCLACLTKFGCRHRLVQHLSAHNKACFNMLADVYEPLDRPTVDLLDKQALADARGVSWISPARKLAGPRSSKELAVHGLRRLTTDDV